jgi:hypothetical protein
MATPKKVSPVKPGAGNALSIVCSREGFRRAGYAFGKQPVVIALTDLSKAQIRQLREEALLTITEVDTDAAE